MTTEQKRTLIQLIVDQNVSGFDAELKNSDTSSNFETFDELFAGKSNTLWMMPDHQVAQITDLDGDVYEYPETEIKACEFCGYRDHKDHFQTCECCKIPCCQLCQSTNFIALDTGDFCRRCEGAN